MTPILNTQLHTIAINGRSDKRSLCLLDLHQSSSSDAQMGRFFTLFELEHATPALIEQYADLSRFLGEFYYEQYAAERNHFEDTIMHANGLLKHFATPDQTNIHALIGLFHGSNVSFSSHGSPDVWLFSARSAQVHILSQEHQDQDTFFGELVEGTLSVQDVIFLASSHIKDYYTSDRLAKIVHGHNGAEIARHLQRSVGELGSSLSFAGIIAEARPAATPKLKERPSAGSHASIETLLRGRDVTEELLEPTVIKNTRMWFKDQWKKRPQSSRAPQRQSNIKPSSEDSFLIGHTLVYLLRTGGVFVTRIAQSSVVAIWRVGRVAGAMLKSSPSSRANASAALGKNVEGRFGSYKNQFSALPSKKRVWYISVLSVVVFALVGSGIWGWSNYSKKKDVLFNKTLSSTSTLLEEANAATIYGAQAQAHGLLDQAYQNLVELKPRGSEQRIKREDLLGIVRDAQIQLRKEVPVNARLLANINADELPGKKSLSFFEEGLLITSKTHNRVATSSLSGTIGQTQSLPASLYDPRISDDRQIMRSGDDLYDFNFSQSKKLISLEGLTDFTLFANRIYTLYTNPSKIETHRAAGDSFSQKGSPWLQNSVLFPLNTSYILVDGSIYLIGKRGSVSKLQKGSVVPFTLTPVEPAIESIEAVWSSEDSNYLYFLEPELGRILVYDKEGKLQAQYMSDSLTNASALVADEDGKTAYFVTERELHSFPLSHIK